MPLKFSKRRSNSLKFLLLIIFAILTYNTACFGESLVEEKAIVCLITDFNKGKPKIGTGFFISPTLIATASHQVTEADAVSVKITAYLQNGTALTAKFPILAQGEGLALLEIPDGVQAHYLLLHNYAVNEGDKVSAVGCQKDRTRLLREGNMIAQHGGKYSQQAVPDLIALDLPIQSGFSGGPLLAENGDVAGIIYGYEEGAKNHSYAITNDKLFKLMADQRLPTFGKTLYLQGIRAFSLRHFEVAQKYFEQATHQQTDYADAYISLGMTLFKLRQFAQARDALLEAILINTDYPLAYYHLGGVYREGLTDRRSALNAYRRYLELDPESSDAEQVKKWLQELGQSASN